MQDLIENMTAEQKLGQLFMANYDKDTISGNAITLIKHFHIGGFLLSLHDFSNRKKIATMNRKLQYYASNKNPLLIAGHQVSDEINHVENLNSMPSEETLYAMNNRLYSKQLAEVIGQEFNQMGINAIPYPNLKVASTGDLREVVTPLANHGRAVVEGFGQSNVVSFVSGLPLAHEIDSFIGPDRKKSNLYPFYEVVSKGADVLIIQDPSEELIKDYIRTNLHFDGIIAYEVPDITSSVDLIADEVIHAINSGVNLLILPFEYEKQTALLNELNERNQDGHINENAIESSVSRIFSVKEKYKMAEMEPNRRLLTPHQINSVKEKIVRKYVTTSLVK